MSQLPSSAPPASRVDPTLRRAFSRALSLAFFWLIASGFAMGLIAGIRDDSGAMAQWAPAVQFVGAGLVSVIVIARGVKEFLDAGRAKRASALVDEALHKLQGEAGGNVAGVSADQVVKSVAQAPNVKVSGDHLARLVEQRKQQHLIDQPWFQAEVGKLIVDYLQPLPRNAKRVLNRFRVTLLIAERRGLLSTPPTVLPQHIGKWLVLAERWPLLRLSLSTIPEKMRQLEQQSAAPPSGVQAPDPFMETVKALAPYYVGDEDLRTFIRSEPRLADILPRLVHYGDVDSRWPQNAA